jgi:hypothetical protein
MGKRLEMLLPAIGGWFLPESSPLRQICGVIKLNNCKYKLNIYIYNHIGAVDILVGPAYHPGCPFPHLPWK